MNAREELRREMTHNHLYMTDEQADELIDAFAHELAEQQRKSIEGFDRDDHWGVLYRPDDVEGLPDLIDPKAQSASTEGDAQ